MATVVTAVRKIEGQFAGAQEVYGHTAAADMTDGIVAIVTGLDYVDGCLVSINEASGAAEFLQLQVEKNKNAAGAAANGTIKVTATVLTLGEAAPNTITHPATGVDIGVDFVAWGYKVPS